MDLLKGPIREGSRGGRAEFKWSDVKDSKDREYYLGVSVKAPTGRWQQNRDIQWYSRGGDDQAAADRAKARAEEIRKIKEAENDALSAALGFKVVRRHTEAELSQGEVDRAIKEAEAGGDERDSGSNEKGIGFGRIGMQLYSGGEREVMAGNTKEDEQKWRPAAPKNPDTNDGRGDGDNRRRRGDDRDGRDKSSRQRRHRSRSGDRNRDKDRDRDRERERHRRHRSRSRSRDRDRRHTNDRRRRDQSRSPNRSPRRDRDDRRERKEHDRRDRDRDDRRRR
ncbi:hypothetical protein H072_5017 [Dactylellina haptotyla CBS 200.50]|uniref:Multiple myeloma tumor-associated protein 2-like N-terminal domain-containing protein n=1 Tax=Dactylellina haptotyla (strain CBS 200.50) TaxID=1284197 RepID=S8AIU5_DACHA|nr:hypothetical protein H072_5017 [Dactylellina haptotyla CBS 200.50]